MLLMGAKPDWRAIPALLEPPVLWKWSPGAVYGIALYLAMKRWGNPLILLVSVLLLGGAYHLALAALGISGDAARAEGLLLHNPEAHGSLWPALLPADLLQCRMGRDGCSGAPHADADSGRFHQRDHEFRRP